MASKTRVTAEDSMDEILQSPQQQAQTTTTESDLDWYDQLGDPDLSSAWKILRNAVAAKILQGSGTPIPFWEDCRLFQHNTIVLQLPRTLSDKLLRRPIQYGVLGPLEKHVAKLSADYARRVAKAAKKATWDRKDYKLELNSDDFEEFRGFEQKIIRLFVRRVQKWSVPRLSSDDVLFDMDSVPTYDGVLYLVHEVFYTPELILSVQVGNDEQISVKKWIPIGFTLTQYTGIRRNGTIGTRATFNRILTIDDGEWAEAAVAADRFQKLIEGSVKIFVDESPSASGLRALFAAATKSATPKLLRGRQPKQKQRELGSPFSPPETTKEQPKEPSQQESRQLPRAKTDWREDGEEREIFKTPAGVATKTATRAQPESPEFVTSTPRPSKRHQEETSAGAKDEEPGDSGERKKKKKKQTTPEGSRSKTKK